MGQPSSRKETGEGIIKEYLLKDWFGKHLVDHVGAKKEFIEFYRDDYIKYS